jgi:DNA-binding transcriptional ArsR family regulator
VTVQHSLDALVEPRRREIMGHLLVAPLSVGELVDRVGLSQPGVSKHLRVLRESGIVEVEQRGKERVYSLSAAPIAELDEWLSSYRALWSTTLDSLGNHLERRHHEHRSTP